MEQEPMTIEQIRATIRSAGDSAWVITDTIQQLDAGKPASQDRKGNIDRNVSHLKLVVGNAEIVASGEDISILQSAITAGETKLAENIWG